MYRTSAYRYPNEVLILSFTLLVVLLVIAVTATATLCASVLFIAAAVVFAYIANRAHHRALLRSAYPLTQRRSPQLYTLAQECATRLQPGAVAFYVVPSKTLNAYTFGLSTPKVVVLYSALLEIMDADELRFIIGHELGHVRLGHTWLNSLVGGMAGIPAANAITALLTMVFLWWNRACEHSADRAGMLACGKPEKAITALIKLVAGPQALNARGMALAYQRIDAEDDTFWGSLNEAFGTHPMVIRRITQIRRYARSREYRRLQKLVDQNVERESRA